MKTAYRLHCAGIDEIKDVYIGVIEFQTYDRNEMIDYINDMEEDDIDDLYTVEVYEAEDDNFVKQGDGKYYTPSQFIEEA